MYENCGTCGETHKSFVREMPDGSSHVYQSAEDFARRERATIAFKIRARAAQGLASPNMEARLVELSR